MKIASTQIIQSQTPSKAIVRPKIQFSRIQFLAMQSLARNDIKVNVIEVLRTPKNK